MDVKNLVKSKLSTWGIFIGLVVGALIGYVFNVINEIYSGVYIIEWIVRNIFQPVGTVFIRSLFMIIVPLVFSSLCLGISNLGDTKTLKRLGITVLAFYIVTTFCAILIGQAVINGFKPGVGLDQEMVSTSVKKMEAQVSGLREKSSWVGKSLWPGIINTVIPKNIIDQFSATNMLAIIFVSIIFGIGLIHLQDPKAKGVLRDSLSGVCSITIMIVGWIMKSAPIAVAALMASAVFNFGIGVMGSVSKYIFCVILGYLIHFFVVYGFIVKFIIKIPLKEFYKRALVIFLTAFSTSSSNATMPVTMETLQKKFGVPQKITSFTIPVGVTFNMDGTALFEVVAAIFIAQVFNVEITLMSHITLIALVLITSIGVAGVPGGSLPILMAAMASMGIPAEGIALILGVDRLLDMGRTVLNVTGDTVATLFVAKRSGINFEENIKRIPA